MFGATICTNTSKMIRNLILALLLVMAIKSTRQVTVPIDDSTTVLISGCGTVLTTGQVIEIMKDKFSMKQEMVNGKKIIVLRGLLYQQT
jgi:hypothetical protein